eukprot:scaffold2708_cov158-Ochromonas_danica.AAC.33
MECVELVVVKGSRWGCSRRECGHEAPGSGRAGFLAEIQSVVDVSRGGVIASMVEPRSLAVVDVAAGVVPLRHDSVKGRRVDVDLRGAISERAEGGGGGGGVDLLRENQSAEVVQQRGVLIGALSLRPSNGAAIGKVFRRVVCAGERGTTWWRCTASTAGAALQRWARREQDYPPALRDTPGRGRARGALARHTAQVDAEVVLAGESRHVSEEARRPEPSRIVGAERKVLEVPQQAQAARPRVSQKVHEALPEGRGVVAVLPVDGPVGDVEGLLFAQEARAVVGGQAVEEAVAGQQRLHGRHACPGVRRQEAPGRQLVGDRAHQQLRVEALCDHEGHRVLPKLIAEAVVAVAQHHSLLPLR